MRCILETAINHSSTHHYKKISFQSSSPA